MTDEERQKLVADLREFTELDNEPWLVRVGRDAADEIERLAALTQSDADDLAKLAARNMRAEADRIDPPAKDEMALITKIRDYELISERLAALAQSDPLPREHQDPSKWPSREDVERAHKLAQSDAEPDPTKVICPNCTHQFTAISVADQERLRAQSDAEPGALYKDIERILDDESAWIARPNPDVTARIAIAAFMKAQSVLTQSAAEPVAWQQTIDDAKDFISSFIVGKESRCRADDVWNRLNEITAPPRPDASAGMIEAAAFLEEKARYQSGPTDRLLRDWAKQLRARAAEAPLDRPRTDPERFDRLEKDVEALRRM